MQSILSSMFLKVSFVLLFSSSVFAIDEKQSGQSHHIFFERLKDFGLYDCRQKFNKERAQTLRHKSSDFAWQNDYLFAGKKLYESCISCEVIDDKNLYDISDHNPIVAEFDL